MTGSPHRLMWLALGAGVVIFTLAVMALVQGDGGGDSVPRWLVGAVAVAGWLGTLLMHEVARRHYDDIKLLWLALEAVARGQMPPEQLTIRFDTETDTGLTSRMASLILDIASRRAIETRRPDQRLASVIASLKDGVLVVTEAGQVSLVNAGAKALLGGERVTVGTSAFAALDRDTMVAAMEAARHSDSKAIDVSISTVDGKWLTARVVDFGEHRGAVVTFPADNIEPVQGGGPHLEIALDLHDVPPEAPAPVADTLLEDLPATILDTETTGLDVGSDSIVSVGAVRVHGLTVFRSTVIDRLVHPRRLIPQRSTAIHGITNAMVTDQPPIAEILPHLLSMLKGTVVIGHNIGFDLTILKRAAKESQLDWPDPVWLDTILLASALDPDETDLNLDAVAERLGVNVSGRHTALGDALVTAEIYVRLIPQLTRRGVRTLGEAVAFSQTASRIVTQQRAAGW